jgi:hypothetical protein
MSTNPFACRFCTRVLSGKQALVYHVTNSCTLNPDSDASKRRNATQRLIEADRLEDELRASTAPVAIAMQRGSDFEDRIFARLEAIEKQAILFNQGIMERFDLIGENLSSIPDMTATLERMFGRQTTQSTIIKKIGETVCPTTAFEFPGSPTANRVEPEPESEPIPAPEPTSKPPLPKTSKMAFTLKPKAVCPLFDECKISAPFTRENMIPHLEGQDHKCTPEELEKFLGRAFP